MPHDHSDSMWKMGRHAKQKREKQRNLNLPNIHCVLVPSIQLSLKKRVSVAFTNKETEAQRR